MSDQADEPPATPIAPSSTSQRNNYPWRLCTGRFFKRLFFAAAIWIVLLIAVVASAVPYGGGSPGLLFVLLGASLICPLWALSGFVPPKGAWERTISGSKLAACITLLALGLGLGGSGLFTWARSGEAERQKQNASRESGIRVCSGDLKQITEPVSVDSLLIESGIVEASKLRELLGGRGLKFVELRAQAGQDWRSKKNTYGVSAFSGDQSQHFGVAPGVTIVRVGLSRKGDAACTTQDMLGLKNFMGQSPTSPDACLRVELDEQSRASHALKAFPADAYPAFIRWSLVEQATGTVLASLTSSDNALHPSRQDGGAKDEQKAIADDIVHCRSPHFSLMNLVYGPARKPDERLSLGQQRITLDIGAAEPDNPASWEVVPVAEEAVDDWNDRASARHGPAWKAAFRIAEQSGWAGYEQGVIDFKAGVIATPQLRARPDLRVVMRGSNKGFMAAWGSGANRVSLAQFGLDGRLLWKRQIVPTLPVQDPRASFGLVGMEWDPREVRLYGFRRNADGNGVDVRVLNVPLPR